MGEIVGDWGESNEDSEKIVAPGDTLDVMTPLSNGYYSLTASGLAGEWLTLADAQGSSEEIITADEQHGWPNGELHLPS